MYQSIKDKFAKEVLPKRQELFGVTNIMAVPRLNKVVLNARVKRGSNVTEEIVAATVQKITGQKPILTKAKKSISNFKIRSGMVVGVKATLRGARAIDFTDRFINVVLPRVRDFSGLSRHAFDGGGNLTVGLPEHIVFPEVAGDDMARLHGLQIVFSTTAKNDAAAGKLLQALGFPFKAVEGKKEKKKKIRRVQDDHKKDKED